MVAVPSSDVPKNRLRVAYVIQNLNFGGMERMVHSLARHLPSHTFEVHIVALEYLGQFSEGLELDARLHRVPPMSRLSLALPRALARVLADIRPDVVHSHAGVWLKTALAARLAGHPPMIHTEHGRQDPVALSDRLIDNLASRLTDVVVSVSDPLAEVLRKQVVHNSAKVRVIPNGVDTLHHRPPTDALALRQSLGVPLDRPVIGFIGRLEPVKNVSMALLALARMQALASSEVGATLVVVGDGSERARLEALSIELGIADRVRFLGWRSDADRLYGAFDIFTLTSRSEGTSVSLLEAMSTAVCPVVTDVGGNRAVLGPELASLLVPVDDVTALARCWQRHLLDSETRLQFSSIARERVVSRFSLTRMVEAHSSLYLEMTRNLGDGKPQHGKQP